MSDKFDERLDSLLKKKKTTEQQTTMGFEEEIKEKLENCDILFIFRQKDGSLEVGEYELVGKDLLVSIMVNAVLLVLLFTKIMGLW